MVAHLVEGFFDELRKLLEFPEFLENRAFMSQVRRASMLWALRCVHVHVVGFNEIYGDLKLCKPEVPMFWKCCSDWLGYNLWLLLWSEVQRYWRRFHFKAGPYRILNFDVSILLIFWILRMFETRFFSRWQSWRIGCRVVQRVLWRISDLCSRDAHYYGNTRTVGFERSGRPLEEGGLLGSKHSRRNPSTVLEQPQLEGRYSRLRVSDRASPLNRELSDQEGYRIKPSLYTAFTPPLTSKNPENTNITTVVPIPAGIKRVFERSLFLGDPELDIDLERRDIVHFDWILDSQLFKLPNHPKTLPKFFWGETSTPQTSTNRTWSAVQRSLFEFLKLWALYLRLYLSKYLETLAVFFWSRRSATKQSRFPVRHSLPESRHSQMQLKPRESSSSAKTRNPLTWPVAVIFVWIFSFFLRFVLIESTWKLLRIFLEQTSCTKTVAFAVRYSVPEFRHW